MPGISLSKKHTPETRWQKKRHGGEVGSSIYRTLAWTLHLQSSGSRLKSVFDSQKHVWCSAVQGYRGAAPSVWEHCRATGPGGQGEGCRLIGLSHQCSKSSSGPHVFPKSQVFIFLPLFTNCSYLGFILPSTVESQPAGFLNVCSGLMWTNISNVHHRSGERRQPQDQTLVVFSMKHYYLKLFHIILRCDSSIHLTKVIQQVGLNTPGKLKPLAKSSVNEWDGKECWWSAA